jgi:hypothetical protein
MQQYDQEQQQVFGENQALYASVNSVLQPILKAGPDQQGFSSAESNTLNAQAVEGTAENYAGAARAVGESLAGEGGGEELPTGGQAEMKAEIAQSAAGQESQQETQIQEANYQTGRENFQMAEQGELAIAAGENPTSYGNMATNSANAAGSEANAIAQEDSSWENALIGAAGSVGEGWAEGGFKT